METLTNSSLLINLKCSILNPKLINSSLLKCSILKPKLINSSLLECSILPRDKDIIINSTKGQVPNTNIYKLKKLYLQIFQIISHNPSKSFGGFPFRPGTRLGFATCPTRLLIIKRNIIIITMRWN